MRRNPARAARRASEGAGGDGIEKCPALAAQVSRRPDDDPVSTHRHGHPQERPLLKRGRSDRLVLEPGGPVPTRDAVRGLVPTVITNAVLFAICLASGHPALYLLWAAAWLTCLQVVIRIRSIAAHGMTTNPDDAFNNARTTYGRWWERLFVAPLNVNYHLEHHLMPAVPYNQLPKLHARLQEIGAFDGKDVAINANYKDVMQAAGAA